MELQLCSLVDKKPDKKGKKSGSNDSVAFLKLASQREQSLALFHLIGKVLYNKRMSQVTCSFNTELQVRREGRPSKFLNNEARARTTTIA